MNEPKRSPIALLTDFGVRDCYVGVMKGVILTIAPDVRLVDLTHETPRHSTMAGAIYLDQAFRYFPAETIFCCVVDPGVGTDRRSIAAKSGDWYFVAPDNGLLSFALADDAEIVSLENTELTLMDVSNTFHGRDVFAPAAAHLARGAELNEFGPPVTDPIRLKWPEIKPIDEDHWELPIVAVDHFGNLLTALRAEDVRRLGLRAFDIRLGDKHIGSLSPTFGGVGQSEWAAYWGSGGLLEIAINGGNAGAVSGLGEGDSLILENTDPNLTPHPDNMST